MLREGRPIGTIAVGRAHAGRFSDRQIDLLKTFADQAVIAIENVRLFKELEARNRELTETLEQQTATGEILRVISSSPTDVQPVFDTIAQSAARLCAAADAHIWQREGDRLRVVASLGALPMTRRELTISRQSVVGRAVNDRRAVHVEDLAEAFHEEFPDSWGMMSLGSRTILAMPLVREGEPIGVIMIRRTEVRPFSSGQVALLKTFADQAVIAIENVRLFKELETRNHDLGRVTRAADGDERDPARDLELADRRPARARRRDGERRSPVRVARLCHLAPGRRPMPPCRAQRRDPHRPRRGVLSPARPRDDSWPIGAGRADHPRR